MRVTRRINFAQNDDLQKLTTFFTEANLVVPNLNNCIENFVIAKNENEQIQMSLGIEQVEQFGMLRSLVIDKTVTSSLLLLAIAQTIELATKKGICELYVVLTKDTFVDIFTALGFELCEQADFPIQLSRSNYYLTTYHNLPVKYLKYVIDCG